MTDRRGARRTQLTLVRGGNYQFSFASEQLSGLWQIGRSEVGIQHLGLFCALKPRLLLLGV